MELIVSRWAYWKQATLGALFMDGELFASTCEDLERNVKIPGRTAIPRGRYRLGLRRGSPMALRYDATHDSIGHDGMLWILDVPGFEYVYFHVGNDPSDTDGCVLTGKRWSLEGIPITGSTETYRRLYPLVYRAIQNEGAWLTVTGAVMGGAALSMAAQGG